MLPKIFSFDVIGKLKITSQVSGKRSQRNYIMLKSRQTIVGFNLSVS